jgi:hypothetical protein
MEGGAVPYIQWSLRQMAAITSYEVEGGTFSNEKPKFHLHN